MPTSHCVVLLTVHLCAMCIVVIDVLTLPSLGHKVGQTKVGQFESDIIAFIICRPCNENVIGFDIMMNSSFH
jgi:hypothetical protein